MIIPIQVFHNPLGDGDRLKETPATAEASQKLLKYNDRSLKSDDNIMLQRLCFSGRGD